MKELLIEYMKNLKNNIEEMQKTYDMLPDGDEMKIELGGRIDTLKYVENDLYGIVESSNE